SAIVDIHRRALWPGSFSVSRRASRRRRDARIARGRRTQSAAPPRISREPSLQARGGPGLRSASRPELDSRRFHFLDLDPCLTSRADDRRLREPNMPQTIVEGRQRNLRRFSVERPVERCEEIPATFVCPGGLLYELAR